MVKLSDQQLLLIKIVFELLDLLLVLLQNRGTRPENEHGLVVGGIKLILAGCLLLLALVHLVEFLHDALQLCVHLIFTSHPLHHLIQLLKLQSDAVSLLLDRQILDFLLIELILQALIGDFQTLDLLLALYLFDFEVLDFVLERSNFLTTHAKLLRSRRQRHDRSATSGCLLIRGELLLTRQVEIILKLNLVLDQKRSESHAFLLEIVGLHPQLCDQLGIWIPVHLRLVLDLSGATRIIEGIQGLVEVRLGWRAASDHGSTRVATQGILQDTGQLGVSVRHEVAFLANLTEGRDDVAKH